MDTLCFPVKRADHFMIPSAMFRTKDRPTHGGDDFTPVVANKPEPVYAIEDGTILIADRSAERGDTSGLDIMLVGKQTGIRWWYGHLSKVGVALHQKVKAGDVLGATGTTGSSKTGKASSTGVHLHLEAHYPRINHEVDPWKWLHDAPDVYGSTMPLATTRAKALEQYPKYVGDKATTPATKDKGFLMALTPDEQAEVLRLLRENADKVKKIDLWLEATRGDQIDDIGQSRAARIHRLMEGMTAKVDALYTELADPGTVGYSWAARARSILNALEDKFLNTK